MSKHRRAPGATENALRHLPDLALNVAPVDLVAVYRAGASSWVRASQTVHPAAGLSLPEALSPFDPYLIHAVATPETSVTDGPPAVSGTPAAWMDRLSDAGVWGHCLLGPAVAPVGLLCAIGRDPVNEAGRSVVAEMLDAFAPIATSLLARDSAPPRRPDASASPPLAVVEWDRDFRIIDWSPAAERIFGYTAQEARGMCGIDLVPEPHRSEVRSLWHERLLQKKGGYYNRNRNQTGDGRIITCEWYNSPLVDGDGRVTGVISLAKDVTDRDAVAQALDADPQFAENLIANMQDGVLVLDVHGTLIRVNDAFCEMTGFGPDDLLGTSAPHPFWPPDAYDDLQDAFQAIQSGQLQSRDLTLLRRNGTRFDVRIHPAEVAGDDGTVVGFFATVRDVTEQRAVREQLAREQGSLRHVLDTLPLMVVTDDFDTGAPYVNREFYRVIDSGTALQPRASTGQRLDAKTASSLSDFLDALSSDWTHYQITTDAGRVLETSWLCVTLPNGARLGLGIDVTAQKEHEAELRRARDEAEAMNRLKTTFLANMSHEIRTPLTSILGFAEAISTDVYDEGGRHQAVRFAQYIKRGGRRLLNTLNALIDLSRLEAGLMTLDPVPVHVPDVVDALATLYADDARKGDIDLHIPSPDDALYVGADRNALELVLSNLLDNALKFTPSGGRVTVTAEGDATTIRIDVIDTGVGIDEAFMPRLFEPFEQESKGTARHFEGTGLGLTVTRRLVELMDGVIGLDSTKGEGTHVRLIFPRLAPPDSTTPRDRP